MGSAAARAVKGLRAAGQSDLRRHGGPLRYHDPAGSAAPAARQGESRGRGADHRAMAARPRDFGLPFSVTGDREGAMREVERLGQATLGTRRLANSRGKPRTMVPRIPWPHQFARLEQGQDHLGIKTSAGRPRKSASRGSRGILVTGSAATHPQVHHRLQDITAQPAGVCCFSSAS
jgi:hypothetical protein